MRESVPKMTSYVSAGYDSGVAGPSDSNVSLNRRIGTKRVHDCGVGDSIAGASPILPTSQVMRRRLDFDTL